MRLYLSSGKTEVRDGHQMDRTKLEFVVYITAALLMLDLAVSQHCILRCKCDHEQNGEGKCGALHYSCQRFSELKECPGPIMWGSPAATSRYLHEIIIAHINRCRHGYVKASNKGCRLRR